MIFEGQNKRIYKDLCCVFVMEVISKSFHSVFMEEEKNE